MRRPTPPRLDQLVATGPSTPKAQAVLAASAVAFVIHAAVMCCAVLLARPAIDRVDVRAPDTVLIALPWPEEPAVPPQRIPVTNSREPEQANVATHASVTSDAVTAPAAMIAIDRDVHSPAAGFQPATALQPVQGPTCTEAICGVTASTGSAEADLGEAPPEILSTPEIRYPSSLWAAGVEGVVVVSFVVDTSGRADPATIEIVESSNVGFHRPAKELVRKSHFRPGVVGGVRVRVPSRLEIEFRLNGIRVVRQITRSEPRPIPRAMRSNTSSDPRP